MINETSKLYFWLEHHFYYDNHPKYKKYFKEWISHLTDSQIIGFTHQMMVEESGILKKQKKTY